MWGLLYKVGRCIAKSGWYFTMTQILKCGSCTMFTLLIFMTLLLRHLHYAYERSFSDWWDIKIKFDLSVNDHILHTFSSVKFRNVKIKLRKFLNDHHIILNVYCFTMFYVQNHLVTLWIFRFNRLCMLSQNSVSFAATKLKPKNLQFLNL